MTQPKTKEPVRIREKRLANGNISLYLDIYLNGKREYEFLRLYLIPERTKEDRLRNRETLRLAEAIKSLRIVDIQNGRYGFSSQYKTDTNFIEYFNRCRDQRRRRESEGNWGNWYSAGKHIEAFFKPDTRFADIDERACLAFKDYIVNKARTKDGKPLSANSQSTYFCKFKAAIRQAYEEHIIPFNVCASVPVPKPDTPEREFLTMEELRAAARTPCKNDVLKRAFLFSCLTGIRWSDISKLKWSEVQQYGDGTRIVFRQKKTNRQEYLDINPQAASLLWERREPEARVFQGIGYSSHMNTELMRWMLNAGITKYITFHCARHTFAVMMLELGADIYTVQKLLGHTDIHTTQIYARVLDKRKQEAVSRIPDLL